MPQSDPSIVTAVVRQFGVQLAALNLMPCGSSFDFAGARGSHLPYTGAKVLAYATQYCSGGNECAQSEYVLDCTHFLSHALAKSDVCVTGMEAKCPSDYCIRAQELGVAFHNASETYSNVHRINAYGDAQAGDYCFIPKWFGLRKEHAMLLASKPNASGCKVFAHTNNRCNDRAPFDASDCFYYRIEDA